MRFQFPPHFAVAGFATRYAEARVTKCFSVRKSDRLVVQIIFPENPVGEYVLVVEWHGTGQSATNEATISLHDVRNEATTTEKDYAIITAEDGAVVCLPKHVGPPAAEGQTTARLSPEAKAGGEEASVQLPMFTRSQKIVNRLKNTDLNNLTPLEAMNLLSELKKQI